MKRKKEKTSVLNEMLKYIDENKEEFGQDTFGGISALSVQRYIICYHFEHGKLIQCFRCQALYHTILFHYDSKDISISQFFN